MDDNTLLWHPPLFGLKHFINNSYDVTVKEIPH